MNATFIKATQEYNTFEKHVNAPCIRRSFRAEAAAQGILKVACCGFYRVFLNGRELTKGFLAPYISNPNHYVYYDEYPVQLDGGENVLALLLGNGFQNNPGGYIWDFDRADFRSAPMAAVELTWFDIQGAHTLLSDSSFRTAPSPITADDYRFGERYDARLELPGWTDKGFDDSAWAPVLEAPTPAGQLRRCEADPLLTEAELSPVAIYPDGDGYIYDFGQSNAGVCRLTVQGTPGQEISLQHTDLMKDGTILLDNNWFVREHWERDRHIVHKDVYTCSGRGTEVYVPSFTYHGFRYVRVQGITPSQATPELLTYIVYHSALPDRGDFVCSDTMVNTLQEMTRRSDLSNFHYFPTDCPQREKNGWTGDAALSAEHMLLNFEPERSYREWVRNICAAQTDAGGLPGIVPTAGWGTCWGNGPAWDNVLLQLPYQLLRYRGDTQTARIAAPHLIKYLHYLNTRKDHRGLLAIGLGDWCHVGRDDPKAPLVVTDSIISMDIADKCAVLMDALGREEDAAFCREFAGDMKAAIRAHLMDFDTMTALGSCQTSQAMFLYYGLLTPEEEPTAFARLLDFIDEAQGHLDVGILGARVLFYVLSRFGYTDLALHMIVRPDYPSYGNWVVRGATTLWENFKPDSVDSPNHHFWGHISGWFITNLAGICLNPELTDVNELQLRPEFPRALTFAQGTHIAPAGQILSRWERQEEHILLTLQIPRDIHARVLLPRGYRFGDGSAEMAVTTGTYTVFPRED